MDRDPVTSCIGFGKAISAFPAPSTIVPYVLAIVFWPFSEKSVPAITVIMPVKNGADTIAASINSILWQTFTDIELRVIDDGSQDGTFELCNAVSEKDKRLTVLRNPGSGISQALNYAIDTSDSEFVARMDADDIAFPERLALQSRYLAERQSLAVVGSSFLRFGKVNAFNPVPISEAECYSCSILFTPFCHPTTLIRRNCLDALAYKYDPDFDGAEDFELFSRILQAYRGENLPEPLLAYRTHDAQVSTTKAQHQRKLARRIIDRNLAEISKGRSRLWIFKDILQSVPRTFVPHVLRSIKNYEIGRSARE